MAKFHTITKSHGFTPFLRFIIVLAVVAFFYSWEPSSLRAPGRMQYKSAHLNESKALPWKYVRSTSINTTPETESSKGLKIKLSPIKVQ